ncbi:MAG: RNA polymerase III C11 subunit [Cirrosporium novae-zelandiae]|nr:MAG: RNA polymerase III C11 subunit [Cirrosporium novae-zelandiae]
MLLFCPACSDTLTVSRSPSSNEHPFGQNRLECRTCPYQFVLEKSYYERTYLTRKEKDDVIGGEDQWKNADEAAAQCADDECDGDRAFFYQIQIRSADEPMTTFYKPKLMPKAVLQMWKGLERELIKDCIRTIYSHLRMNKEQEL